MGERLADLEQRLQTFLDEMSEDMALEVEREQQHLMLMQDQVGKKMPYVVEVYINKYIYSKIVL